MKLLLKKMRRHQSKSKKYTYLSKLGPIDLEMGVPCEVPDQVAYEILERDGDIIEKVEPPKPKPVVRRKSPQRNKMMSKVEKDK